MGRRWRDSVRLRLIGQHWRDPERLRLVGLAAVLAVVTTFAVREARRPGPWQRVFATREGLLHPGADGVKLPRNGATAARTARGLDAYSREDCEA